MPPRQGQLAGLAALGFVSLAVTAMLVVNGCSRPSVAADADVLVFLETPRTEAEQAELIDLGRRLYLRNSCHNCHGMDGKTGNGAPQLRNLYTTQAELTDGSLVDRDRAYVVRSILRPAEQVVVGYPQQMTNGYRFLPSEEIAAIITYIEQYSPLPRAGQNTLANEDEPTGERNSPNTSAE